jgi:hypothetical protein
MDAVTRLMPYYASVHRGTGFKSRLCTVAYDQAHEIVAEFVGADLRTNTVIFGKNTTEAINKLSFRLPANRDHVVITTQTGASLQRPALARPFPRGACAGALRWPLRRGAFRPPAGRLCRPHRAGGRHRRLQRQRLYPADPSPGGQGPRGRRAHSGGCRPARAPSPGGDVARRSPAASGLRGALGAQDVCALWRGRFDRPQGSVPAQRAGISWRRHRRRGDAGRGALGRRARPRGGPAAPTWSARWPWPRPRRR